MNDFMYNFLIEHGYIGVVAFVFSGYALAAILSYINEKMKNDNNKD